MATPHSYARHMVAMADRSPGSPWPWKSSGSAAGCASNISCEQRGKILTRCKGNRLLGRRASFIDGLYRLKWWCELILWYFMWFWLILHIICDISRFLRGYNPCTLDYLTFQSNYDTRDVHPTMLLGRQLPDSHAQFTLVPCGTLPPKYLGIGCSSRTNRGLIHISSIAVNPSWFVSETMRILWDGWETPSSSLAPLWIGNIWGIWIPLAP